MGLAASAVALCAPALGLAAACTTQGSANAAPIALEDAQTASHLLVLLSVWVGLMESKGGVGSVAEWKAWCDRTTFSTKAGGFTLRGEDDAGAAPRVAVSDRAKAPVVYLTPIPDFMAVLATKQSGTAPTAGFALMTLADQTHTAWRIYDAIPTDAVLVRDIGDVFAGAIRPAMRVKGNDVTIIVPPAK